MTFKPGDKVRRIRKSCGYPGGCVEVGDVHIVAYESAGWLSLVGVAPDQKFNGKYFELVENLKMTQEWAIQDEATGEWWTGEDWGRPAWRFATYPIAMNSGMHQMQAFSKAIPLTIRIVPAPPREMTDAEARIWFLANAPGRFVLRAHRAHYFWVEDDKLGGEVGRGQTIEDAIRAARRKIESDK